MNGEVLFNAIRIASQAGQEIEAMKEKLFGLLEADLKSAIDDISRIEDLPEDGDDPSGWACVGNISQYALYKKSKKKPTAYIALQLKLADEKEMSIVGREPLAYVLFATDNEEWEYEDFTLTEAVNDGWKLSSAWLWEYTDLDAGVGSGSHWSERAWWAFVLPLVSLNSVDDLKRQIVSPTVALMRGDPPERAFAGADKVLRFELNGNDVRMLR